MSVESFKKVLGDNRAEGNAPTLLGEQGAGQHLLTPLGRRKKALNLRVITGGRAKFSFSVADENREMCEARCARGEVSLDFNGGKINPRNPVSCYW